MYIFEDNRQDCTYPSAALIGRTGIIRGFDTAWVPYIALVTDKVVVMDNVVVNLEEK